MKSTIDNDVVYVAKLHGIVFFWPAALVCAGLMLGAFYPMVSPVAFFFIGFGLLWLVMTWVTFYFSSLTIKKKQVILRSGLLVRQTVDIPMTKIETIDIRQTILGSLLRYGTLVITGTGGTRHFISTLNTPLTCRRYIEQLMHV